MHFSKVDNHVAFYELFILWCVNSVKCVAMRSRERVGDRETVRSAPVF
jgi:hypothetical protein